ncbi:siroheme synthase [Enterococcus florum]|uniref:precorrin-2 dehydrogenase n=1 Tax=Enterococcus florum TaxID=2480627 RepID=A0A4P5PBR6_9ENTE|nr:bifunctional precorrin-2 dehydrogenase/sirohydrochlorin ferrochelatase [Enterococcus florum]GCF95186.1 siroheme synthase [Enterococcus florum]
MYPIMIDIKQFPVIVFGGGKIATRKVRQLVKEAARPMVIAPDLTEELEDLLRHDKITAQKRPFKAGDTTSYTFVFICTNDSAVNQQILEETTAEQFVNDTTKQERSNFFNLAIVEKKGFKIAISSQGSSPTKTKQLKQKIEKLIENEEA